LLVIFGGIVLQAPLSVWLGTLLPDYSLLIKSWKEVLMVVLVPIACVLVARRNLWQELLRDWVFRLIVAYAALHAVIAAVLYKGLLATAAGLAIDLRYIVFFGLVYILIRIRPDYRLRLFIVAAAGAVVVVGFGVLQLFLPPDILKYIGYSTKTIVPYLTVDQNHDFIRINSTLRGPNPVGAYAVMVLAVLASLLARQAARLKTPARRWAFAAMTAASFVVLWVSYSRSAYIGALIALGIILAATADRRLSTRWWVIGCIVVCALVGGLLAAKGNSFISNTLLHDNPQGGSSTTSNEGHAQSLQAGFSDLLHHPLGTGVGSTGSASLYGQAPTIVENQYLFIGHEIGWLGVTLFVTLFSIILVRAWRGRRNWLALSVFASGVGLAFIGLLLPVWVDDTVSIIWWGLAAIMLASLKTKESL
jgi:general stress protein CsbA